MNQHGWSKVAVGMMRKLDSFMREAQRLNGITLGRPCFSQPARHLLTVS